MVHIIVPTQKDVWRQNKASVRENRSATELSTKWSICTFYVNAIFFTNTSTLWIGGFRPKRTCPFYQQWEYFSPSSVAFLFTLNDVLFASIHFFPIFVLPPFMCWYAVYGSYILEKLNFSLEMHALKMALLVKNISYWSFLFEIAAMLLAHFSAMPAPILTNVYQMKAHY